MVDRSKLDALFLKWQQSRQQGRAASPEELCRDCPELAHLLSRRIAEFSAAEQPGSHDIATVEASANPAQSSAQGELTLGYSAPANDAAKELPQRAGRYQLRGEIARGGMGVVVRAHDPEFDRRLAVKIMLHQHKENESWEARFWAEAKIAGRLQHPGVAPLYDLGRLEDGRPFFAMKLIEGSTLSALLKESGDSYRHADKTKHDADQNDFHRFVSIFEQICQTLAYAHSHGIIHRDLKPANIMVGSFGEVQVMDWGLAKIVNRESWIVDRESVDKRPTNHEPRITAHEDTQAGTVLGTPAFMSPEQARGEIHSLDERCDVFGLGAILCAMATGRPPFADGNATENHRLAAKGELGSAFERLDRCEIDGELIQLAKRCLAPNKEDRPRHAGAVAAAVAEYQTGVQDKLRQSELQRKEAEVRAAEQRKRRWIKASLYIAIWMIVLGAVIALTFYGRIQVQKQLAFISQKQEVLTKMSNHLNESQGLSWGLRDTLSNPRKADKMQSNLPDWKQKIELARAAWKRAQTLAADKREFISQDSMERLRAVNKQLQVDEHDWKVAAELDRIRVAAATPVKSKFLKSNDLSPGYAKAFELGKLDVMRGDLKKVVAKLKKSHIRHAFLSALDHWSIVDAKLRPRLLEIARLADPDPWRDRFRNPNTWDDIPALKKLAAEVNPKEQSPQVLEALIARMHSHADVTIVLRRALAHHPDNFYLLYHLGKSTYGAPTLRTGAYRAALALRPESSEALLRLAKTLGDCGRSEEAIAYYQAVLRIDPHYGLAHHNLGLELASRGELNQALVHLREAVRINPEQGDTHGNLGLILLRMGQFPEAKKHLQKALSVLSPTDRARDFFSHHLQLCVRLGVLAAKEPLIPIDEKAARIGLKGKLADENERDPYRPESCRKSYACRFRAGESYLLDLKGKFDTYLRIENARFNPVLSNDDVSPHHDLGDGANPRSDLNSRLVFVSPQDAIYGLVVTSYVGGAKGDYELRVRSIVKDGPAQVIDGTLEITTNNFQGKFGKGQKIKLKKNQPHTIELETESFDSYLALLTGTGNHLLATNDNISPTNLRISRIDFTPKEDTEFLLVVTSSRPGQSGPYTLRIQRWVLPK